MTGGHVGRRLAKDAVFKGVVCLLAFLSLLPLFLILYYITLKGISVINWDFLFSLPRPIGEAGGGVVNAIVGTLMLIVLSSVISVPCGIAAGIYLSENKAGKLSNTIRLCVIVLQGTPSIVIGIIAYLWVVAPLKTFSALSGGVALSIMMLPVIIKTTEETLKLLPYHLKEASGPGRALLPDHSQGHTPFGHKRYPHRHSPQRGEDYGGDGAASVHRIWQSVHERQYLQADRLPALPHILLRHEPLPRVAFLRVGGLVHPCRSDACPEPYRKGDLR